MVKYFIIFLSLLSCIGNSQNAFNFSIQGFLKNVKDGGYVYIHHKGDKKDVTDSVKTRSGKFTFNSKAQESNMYWMTKTNNKSEQPSLIFFNDPGKIIINGNIDSIYIAKVNGGQTQKDFVEYNSLMQKYAIRQQTIVNEYNDAKTKGDNAVLNAKALEYQAVEGEVKVAMEEFIKNHSKSSVSAYAIYYYSQNPSAQNEEIEKMVALLDKSMLNTKAGLLAQEKLIQQRGTSIGYTATNFAQQTPDGKMVNLTDFKGKYVLVDFWASWCGPCRAENPNVVKAFNAYKDKGFTVLGVSFDQTKDKWLQAIGADNLTWTQVSDLKGWGNEAGKIFNITSIPQNLLLDKEGKIIAKNLRGADLEKKLEEVIK